MAKQFPQVGALVLCGGSSVRMGYDKWRLPVAEQTLLEYIVRPILQDCGEVVVCCGDRQIDAAIDQVTFVQDEYEACGPLEGIRAGLAKLSSGYEFAYVTACDVPYFYTDVLRLLLDSLADKEAAIPVRGGSTERVFGMTSVYRTSVHEKIGRLVDTKQLRVAQLAQTLDTARVDIEAIREVDPDLNCLSNINTPSEYFAWLEQMGFHCSDEIRQMLKKNDDRQI